MTDVSSHELLVTFILIAPLAITLIVLTVNFIRTGLQDLSDKWKIKEKHSETPQLTEQYNEAEIDGNDHNLNKEGNP